MRTNCSLSDALLDEPMRQYFRRKFATLPDEELDLRIEETLRYLFLSHECTGSIPVSKEIDEVWHAWILQTQEYMTLCERLPNGGYIHHSSNDYLRYFDPQVGEHDDLEQDVRMLALYVVNFGPFDERRARHWLLASHLMQCHGWTVCELNAWLSDTSPAEVQGATADRGASGLDRQSARSELAEAHHS